MCGYGRVGETTGLFVELHWRVTLVPSTTLCHRCSIIHQTISTYRVKVLLPGHALKCYATSKNVVHGLHLDCFWRCAGGDGSGDEGECL